MVDTFDKLHLTHSEGQILLDIDQTHELSVGAKGPVVGGLHQHQHGADLDESPVRGAGIQGHNTAVSTEHNLVDPVPDEESKVPGNLPIRNLGSIS